MFTSVETLLQKANGSYVNFLWIKFFTDTKTMPKNFLTHFPELENIIDEFKFTKIETKVVKKAITNITEQNELQKVLIDLFELNSEISRTDIDVFKRVTNLTITKENKKSVGFIFRHAIRIFAKIVFQLPKEISNSLDKRMPVSFILTNIHTILTFFSQFEGKKFMYFHTFLVPFLSEFSSRFNDILRPRTTDKMQEVSLAIMGSLVPIARVYISSHEGEDSPSINFITEQLDKICTLIDNNGMSKSIAYSIRTTISSIVPYVDIINEKQCENLCCTSLLLIGTILISKNLDTTEIYQTCVICMRLYNETCRFQVNRMEKYQFNNIALFIIWLITTCQDAIIEDESELPPKFVEPKELGPIDRAEYFNTYGTIGDTEYLTFSRRLKSVADLILSIYEHYKDPSPFVANLIDMIKEQEEKTTPEKYRTFVAFVLYLIGKVPENVVNSAVGNNWSLIISPIIFPLDTSKPSDVRLRNTVLNIVLRTYIIDPQSRKMILYTIALYFTRNPEAGKSYFMQLINSMLIVEDTTDFIAILAKSTLIQKLVSLARKSLMIFDFLRICTNCKPGTMLTCPEMFNLCMDFIGDPIYQKSIFDMFLQAFYVTQKDTKKFTVIQNLMKLLSKRILTIDAELAIRIVEIVLSMASQWTEEFITTSPYLKEFIEVISLIPVNHFKNEIFMRLVQQYVNIIIISPITFYFMTQPDLTLYNNLKLAAQKRILESDEGTRILFEFVFANSYKSEEYHFIRNSKALEVLMEWSKGSSKEKEILLRLSKFAFRSKTNIYQMNCACLPEHILWRLKTIGNDIGLLSDILQLFSVLVRNGFTNSVLFESIRLMRSSDFAFPNLVLSTYFRLITFEKATGPSCFFHFEGTATGIFGPTVVIPENSLFVTSLCIDKTFVNEVQPILVIKSESKEGITLQVTRQNLILSHNNSNAAQLTGTHNIEVDKWMLIAISFTAKGITVYLDGKQDIQSKPIPLGSISYDILIGAHSDSIYETGFIGDIGPTYLIRGTDMSKIEIELSPKEIKNIFGKNIVLMYSPRATQHTKILNVMSDASTSANIRGQSIPFVSNLIDILSSVAAIPNIMPILQRTQYCEHCEGVHNEPCPYCHSISTQNGRELIILILQIFTMLFKHSKSVQITFKSFRGYRLLCGFLSKISNVCIDERTIQALFELFYSSKDIELARQAIEDILLNFDFIMRLSNKMQDLLVSSLLSKVIHKYPEPFLSFPSVDFLIYRAMSFTQDKSPLSGFVWKLLTTVISQAPNSQLCTTLISIITNINDPLILNPVLDILLLLIDNSGEEINRILSIFDYYLPFAFPMACNSNAVRAKTIQIIQLIDAPSFININLFITYCILSINVNYKDDDIDQVIDRLSFMIFNIHETNFDTPHILPLFVLFLKMVPKERAKEFCNTFTNLIKTNQEYTLSITKLNNWYYWVMEFYLTIYDGPADMNKFINVFSIIFNEQLSHNASDDLSEFFTLLDIKSLEYHIDFSPMKKRILCYITGIDNKSSIKVIVKELFKYMFIHQSIENPVEAPEQRPKELRKIIPSQKYYPSSITFGIILDEKGNWKDLDIAKAILTLIPLIEDFSFEIIDMIPIGSFETIAYIASYLARFDQKRFINSMDKFIEKMKDVNYDSAYRAASMLYLTITKLDIEYSNIDKLLFYVDNYKDDCDSPEYQYFIFEDKFGSSLKILLGQYIVNQSTLIQTMTSRIEKILGVDDANNLVMSEEDSTIIEAIVRISKPQVYKPLKGAMERFMTRQKETLETDRAIVEKHTNSFLRELSLSGGPWADEMKDEHFMTSSYISTRGRRVILALNHNFDDHRKASELRDSGKSDAKVKQSLPRLKELNRDSFIIRHDTFRAFVQLISAKRSFDGEISIDSGRLIFDSRGKDGKKHVIIPCNSIEFILSRKQNYQNVACEIFVNYNRSFYFVFASPEEREHFYKVLVPIFPPRYEFENNGKFFFFRELRKAENGRIQVSSSPELVKKIGITEKWQTDQITTYEYLYYLNLLSGRSFNDLSQYPVYPWILKDYESETIDLSNPEVYRDLSRPIGALNSNRIEMLKIIYQEFPDPNERCLYRSHFSSMASVSSYLIRVEPFTSLHILLQEGRFDVPGRLFSSVQKDWKNITSEENDFRELIPEFFTLPEFLSNNSNYDLGRKRETNEKVDDVILPPWASSPWEFIDINRKALESDITSKSINKWIDLIFGVNRCSEEANNIFHPLSYPEKEKGPEISPEQIHNHCINFGICPDQLFFEPHPQRNPRQELKPFIDVDFGSEVLSIRKGVAILANGFYINLKEVPAIAKSLPGSFGSLLCISDTYSIGIFKQKFDNFVTAIEFEKGTVHTVTHDIGPIRSATVVDGRYLVTGGSDCSLRIWGLPKFVLLRISTLHSDQVIAVAGCLELGIIASLDKHNLLILETLRKGKFMCSTQLSVSSNNPMLEMLKSGLIVFADPEGSSTTITVFDTKLSVVASTELQGKVTELRKSSDGVGGEYIIVVIGCSVIILEAYSLRTISTFDEGDQCLHVCPISKSRAFYCSVKDTIKRFVF